MLNQQPQHFTLFPVASQQLHVAFDGGRIVSDAGLLAVRALEKPLRVIADLAQRLPDPRSPKGASKNDFQVFSYNVLRAFRRDILEDPSWLTTRFINASVPIVSVANNIPTADTTDASTS